ncbi:MAG: hypothetical protein Hals2KO_04810 [Halioglobus sp.]
MVQEQETFAEYGGDRRRVSLAMLVMANLLPLAGVLFFDWDIAYLMLLYWSENLILGFYTLLRMLTRAAPGDLFLCVFFCIHYGGFCAGHGVFLVAFLLDGEMIQFNMATHWPLLIAFAALFVSHGVSFVTNFLRGPERDVKTVKEIMMMPYGRIVLLHVAILAGGWGAAALGQPVVMLVALVVLKIAVDVRLHLREHAAAAAGLQQSG